LNQEKVLQERQVKKERLHEEACKGLFAVKDAKLQEAQLRERTHFHEFMARLKENEENERCLNK